MLILFFIRCQNQTNLNSQVSVIVPPTPPTSITPPPSSSSPSRPSSSNDAKIPYSSANSPSSKKPVSNRFSNNNNPPILPSYPPLPPSNNRPSNHITSSSSGSSSSADASRSLPSVEVNQSSVARARRRIRVRQNNPLPINDQQMDINFLSKLRENDTLQRRNREKKINNHLKQYQQLSSDDEHELISQANPSQAVVVYIDLCSLFIFDFNLIFRLLFHQKNQFDRIPQHHQLNLIIVNSHLMMIVVVFLMNVNHHDNHRNRKLPIHMIQIIFRISMLVNVVEIVEYNPQLKHQVQQQQRIALIMNPHKNPIPRKLKRKKKGKK